MQIHLETHGCQKTMLNLKASVPRKKKKKISVKEPNLGKMLLKSAQFLVIEMVWLPYIFLCLLKI